MILDRHMRLVEPACAWLMHIALVRGRTRSPQTWRTYGEALHDWWQALEANDWAWDRVGPDELAAWRDGMLAVPSVRTGRPYAVATINARLRTVARFYKWCALRDLVHTVPFEAEKVSVTRSRPRLALAHIDASGGVVSANELVLREVPGLPVPLAAGAIRAVLAQLGPRDRLAVEWAAMTGMRRMEIAAMPVASLPRTASIDFSAFPVVPLRLIRTKGGMPRMVYAPMPLVDRTWAYLREERATAVESARRRSAGYLEPATVFVTKRGEAMSPRRVGAMFATACERAEVRATFHVLRHTFAGAMLRILQRQAATRPELNPMLTLQTLLGHANLATTALYLRMLSVDLEAIEAAVDDLFAALR